jgi:hypothetical protein
VTIYFSVRGQGLGKKEDGIVEHLKIKKKDDDGGIGIDAVKKEQRDEVLSFVS